jgi:hypothetical protein
MPKRSRSDRGENICLKQKVICASGSTKRPYEQSWQYAFEKLT